MQHQQQQQKQRLPLKFSEWLASPWGSKFSKPLQEMCKEELNACLKGLVYQKEVIFTKVPP